LAELCRVSRRTIFRDLDSLRESGVPLAFDSEHDRYFIPSAFFLPPTNFTAQEALAIITLVGKITTGARLPFSEPARMAALKLESSLPTSLRRDVRSVARRIQINMNQVNPLEGKDSIYQRLASCIEERQVVKVKYGSLFECERITTKLRPYQLLFSRRSWYVFGRSSLHRGIRTFNVGRIVELEVLKQKYSIPNKFNLERHFGNAWHMIPDAGADSHVVIRFQSLVAQNVAEVLWHKTQQIEWRDDGTMDYTVHVSGLNEIAWWILGYGDQAEVLQPLKLRRLVAKRVANMHRLYC
jgi:proteasome accessory factor B